MKYCQDLTLAHIQSTTYPQIINIVDELIKNEGCQLAPSPFDGNTSSVINGDVLEEAVTLAAGRTLGQKQKSVDLIFAIKLADNSITEFQFVEFKLRTQQDFYYLNKFDIREKINYSLIALGNSVPVSKKYFLVFKKEILNQAERYLFRINPKLNNDFKAIDVVTLHQLFF